MREEAIISGASDNSRYLRNTRLMFYRDDVERMNRVLNDFLKLSGAKSTILVDKEGHPITQVGETQTIRLDTIAALVAASYMATKELARILGQAEFAILTHQGETDSIQFNLVADRCILTTMFDDSTTVGMVRMYAQQAAAKMNKLFTEMATRKDTPTETIQEGFGDAAQDALENLFG